MTDRECGDCQQQTGPCTHQQKQTKDEHQMIDPAPYVLAPEPRILNHYPLATGLLGDLKLRLTRVYHALVNPLVEQHQAHHRRGAIFSQASHA